MNQKFLVATSFITILKKDCRLLPVEDNSKLWSSLVNNQTLQVEYIEHYYDDVQLYHIIIVTIDMLIFMLAFLNVAPSQEDIRFGFHLLVSWRINQRKIKVEYCFPFPLAHNNVGCHYHTSLLYVVRILLHALSRIRTTRG